MAFQFLHFDLVSRSVPKKARARRWTVSEVLAEAARHPDACRHVARPRTPTLVVGVELPTVETMVNERAAKAKDARGRSLRKDSPALLAGVASYPVPRERMTEEDWQDYRGWEKRVIGWLRAQFAENLASVVRHEDESHIHLHFFALPPLTSDGRLNVSAIHPGVAARETAKAAGGKMNEANRAYCSAMRGIQSHFHNTVSLYHGHLREGPRRRRLSRGAYLAEKAEAKERANLMKRIEVDLLELEDLRLAKVRNQKAQERALLLERENSQLRTRAESLERAFTTANHGLNTERQIKKKLQSAVKHSAGIVVGLIALVVVGSKRSREMLLAADIPQGVHPEVWGRLRRFLVGSDGHSGGLERPGAHADDAPGRQRHRYRHGVRIK